MPDKQQLLPKITPKDLEDKTLFRLNENLAFLANQLAQAQGITGNYIFPKLTVKDGLLTSEDVPADPKGILSLGAGKSVFALITAIQVGTGSPEGAVIAPVGSVYIQSDGAPGSIVWVKSTGSSNIGWTNLL